MFDVRMLLKFRLLAIYSLFGMYNIALYIESI